MTRLKAILFDLDDTLIDWSDFSNDWRALETKHLGNVLTYISEEVYPIDVELDFFVETYLTMNRDSWSAARSTLRAPHMGHVLLGALVAIGVPPEKLDMEDCFQVYKWGAIPGTKVFPEVPQILQLLLDRGIKICIVTNASQPIRVRDAEILEHGLMPYFQDYRLAAADAGYLKPHPKIFHHALETVGAKPEETVFVGDNPVADIVGAQGVGIRAILRNIHPQSPLIDQLVTPDAILTSLDELPAILDEWFPGW